MARKRACYSPGKVTYAILLSPLFLVSLLFAGAISNLPPTDAPVPATPAASDRVRMADEYLLPRLEVWQKRLKLEGWKITLVQSKLSELRPGTVGNIHWDESDKTARIRVLAASEYNSEYSAALRDMECTLIHELVHLVVSVRPRSDASREDEERVVSDISEAMLALERVTSR